MTMTIREKRFLCPVCEELNPASVWNQLTQEFCPPGEQITPIQNAKRAGWLNEEYVCPTCGALSRLGDIDMLEGRQSDW